MAALGDVRSLVVPRPLTGTLLKIREDTLVAAAAAPEAAAAAAAAAADDTPRAVGGSASRKLAWRVFRVAIDDTARDSLRDRVRRAGLRAVGCC